MEKNDVTGVIFNIQHYCIHDGPGIRTTVFLKGCPLRCRWCANPESQVIKSQLMFMEQNCIKCKLCVQKCKNNAIAFENNKIVMDRQKCTVCGECVNVCPKEAREIIGRSISAEDVFKEVNKDSLFYFTSGGGVTLSGGEVFSQPEFASGILAFCRENNLHTAIETCGFSKWETIKPVLQNVDLVLFDIKHMDNDLHKEGTGTGNELILENLKKISNETKIPVIARTPIITGYNDSFENIDQMGKFLKENVPTCIEVNLLPYHSMGKSKEEQLEMINDFKTSIPTDEKINELKEILKTYGLNVK